MRTALIALVLLVTTASAMAEPEMRTERRRSRVVAAWAFLGLGGASLATSLGLGYAADRRYEAAFEAGHCEVQQDGARLCDPVGYRQTQSALTLGDVATGFAVVGWGFVATAAIVYFTAPRDPLAIAPTATADGAGLVVAGQF